MIQFDQSSREFLINNSKFLLTTLLSITAFMVAVYSLIYSITGFNNYSVIAGVIFIIILVPFWVKTLPNAKRDIKNAKELNKQMENELFELYSEYKRKYH